MENRNNVMMNTACIALGANLGDKIENCRHGMDLLTAAGDVAIVARSRFYATEPMDYTDQPWFVNAAIKVVTSLGPHDLLRQLKRVEAAMGRCDTGIRFGPRVLDLDIIFFNDAVIDTPDLVVPHPRMHQRAFVLHPMADIASDWLHPVYGVAVRQLCDNLNDKNQKCICMDEYDSGVPRTAAADNCFTPSVRPVSTGG